jgi:hypothetical protein
LVVAQQKVKHLCFMVQQMHYFTQANAPIQQLSLSLRAACGNAEQDLDSLLNKLSSEVEAHSNCEAGQAQRAQLSGLANGV